jgi:hypothetical protein
MNYIWLKKMVSGNGKVSSNQNRQDECGNSGDTVLNYGYPIIGYVAAEFLQFMT